MQLGEVTDNEQRTEVDLLLKDVAVVRIRCFKQEKDENVSYFLFGMEFVDKTGAIVGHIDTGDQRGDWTSFNLEEGESIVGFYGQMWDGDPPRSIIGLGMMIAK